MTKRIVPEFEFLDDDTAITRTPYSPDWVENYKDLVPPTQRDWDPDLREWTTFGKRHIAAALLLTKRHFGRVEIIDSRNAGTATRAVANLDADFARLYLVPGAPAPLVQAAYRCLAKLSHPDVGGSTIQMQSINSAYAALQEAGCV